jgi:prevent-host-death family protein
MSESVSVHEAKTHLSRLIQKVEAGGSIVITRGGKPVARLEALSASPRRPGSLKGRIRIARDFEAPLPAELLRQFRGEAE